MRGYRYWRVQRALSKASTSAGHSSGTRTGRQLPRSDRSLVISSHSTTPKLNESTCSTIQSIH